MQFIKNGPDVPERLLQAHEDGRVVLFCGAGISRPAGLQGFDGLVKSLYDKLNPERDEVQKAAIKAGQFDTAIGLLEAGIVGGREKVRNTLADILSPSLDAPKATATHESLLTLSRNRDGRTRIITTNFDRLFEEVITKYKSFNHIQRFQAPLLPVPKSRWSGLVYLHGLLPDAPAVGELDRLVVSSGDFGLAYLTERWAARFVSELFRNYTVCFIGYSIGDPVLRYMTDALAADRLLGESSPEMFAFASYSKDEEDERRNEWKAKNVTPILYRECGCHRYLHKTLRSWAETYRDGLLGKERIVAEYAMSRPLASTRQDDFAGRVLWALSDSSGLPAKRFADLDPVPPLDWLEPLSEERYNQVDPDRFGVQPQADNDDEMAFSLLRRPSPSTQARRMSLVDTAATGPKLDEIMRHLARWLTRHLDDPALVLWLAKRGGRLHREFASLIESRMEDLDRLEKQGKTEELARIRAGAPRAIPRPEMRKLWGLLLTGRVKFPEISHSPHLGIHNWSNRFQRGGLTATLRLELRETLTPYVYLREKIRWFDGKNRWLGDGDAEESDRNRDPVDWEIVLSSKHVHSELPSLRRSPRWNEALPSLLDDFSTLLRDTMDLMRELGRADDRCDLSCIGQPSISDHSQNKHLHDWTALIELTRDAWLATATFAPERAKVVAESWRFVPYPLFRRLAFFAATQEDVIPLRQSIEWLLAEDHWWLWSNQTRREAIRLLVVLAPKLDAESLVELEQAILAGPPRAMFRKEFESDSFTQIVEKEIWLRLAKMKAAGAALRRNAQTKLNELTSRHPEWKLAEDERDEFSTWTSDGSKLIEHIATSHRRRELAEWLRQHPELEKDYLQQDDWPQRCRENFPTTACALCTLAKENIWPIPRWRQALLVWSEESMAGRSWRYLAPMLVSAPDEVLQSLASGLGWWLYNAAKISDRHEEEFFKLCRRILALKHLAPPDDGADDVMAEAINHPVGRVTEALLNWWGRRSLEDGQGLPDELRDIFTNLCDVRNGAFRHGRVLLAAQTIVLFRVDSDWTTKHLLTLFDWNRSRAGASSAWKGFLCSPPRLYRPLMEHLKGPFLDTVRHYRDIGKNRGNYAALLTFAALDPGDVFTTAELVKATRQLPSEGLKEASKALVRSLEGAGQQRAEYWNNRISPYLNSIWPNSIELKNPDISENLAILCVVAQNEFPEAVKTLRHWLQPPLYPGRLMLEFKETDYCRRFPESALDFLYLVIDPKTRWFLDDLERYLEQIRTAEPKLQDDPRFQKLQNIRRGGSS